MDDEDSQDEQIIGNAALRKGKRQTPALISEESSGSSGDDTDNDDEDFDDEAEEGSEGEAEGSDLEEDGDEDPEEETEDTVQHLESADSKSAKCTPSSSDEDAENCPICLNVFRDQVVGTPENCAHYFCLDCILEWSKNASSCPVDRITFSCVCIRAHFGGEILKKIPVESRTAQVEEEDDITNCQVCGRSDREDRLLLCDGCDSGYHMECLTPPLSAVPVDEWFCPQCEAENRPSNDADSLSDEEAIIPQPPVTPSTSRPQTNGMRTRAIARTRQSERVRASVNQLRIRTAQRIQHVPNYLAASLLDDTIEAVVAGLNTAVYQRPFASRSTTNQKAKAGRKKKLTGKKKTRTRSRNKGRKTGKRRRRKKAKKLKPAKDVTVRSRIARTLGLCKPVRGVSIPAVQRAVEPSLGCLRADIGAASLSVFGDPYELDPFDSNEEHPVSPASPLSTKRRILSRSALQSHQPVARPISVGLSSRNVPAPIREPIAETAPLPDLLGSILTGQNFLMMNSSDIFISRDGSLMAKNTACLTQKSIPNESRNGETQRYCLNPGPMPSGAGMSMLTAESPKLVAPTAQAQPASVNHSTSSPTLFLPRGLERALNPVARSLGIAAEQLHNAIVSRVPPSQNSESMRKLGETPRFNGDSKQPSRSFPIATPTHNASCVKSSPTRPLLKPSVRLDISELPRIPKIKRDESGEHPKSASRTGSVGIPSSCINHLTGKGDSSQPSRFTTVQNNKSSSRESQEQHSHGGGSSTFTNTSASGDAASHVSGGSRVLEAQSGGGFRITISGNAGHSSRLFSPSSCDPFHNTDKIQQKPSSPSCDNSSKKAKPVKSEIYDPFDPTGSDSSSAHSSPERTEPQAAVPTNSAKIGTFRSFRFFTTMPKISVSRLGPVFSDAPSPSPPRSTELRSDSALKQIIIERSMETMAEKVIKVENDNTNEENNHIAASCTTRSVRLTPELEHWKAKISEDTVEFHEEEEPSDCSMKAELNTKISLGKESQQKATEKHQPRKTESSSPSRSNSSSHSQKKPKKEKKSLSKRQRKTSSRSHSRERSSRSASWSTEEDRSKKARYKSKGHRASSGHSSSSSRERYKKKKVKEKKSKSSWYWERKKSRSGSPSPDYYYSRKKKKRRSRSHSRGRERSWSSSEERAKRRKHKRDRSHDRYDKRESGSHGRERWRSRSRERKRPRSRSHSREYKRAKSRDRWLHTKERYSGSKEPYYSPHRRKVASISIDSTVKHSSTKLQMWHPPEEQELLKAKPKQKASGVALVEEKDLKESMKRERIGEALTDALADDFVKTESAGSQGSPEPFVSPPQWEIIDDTSAHAGSLYDSISAMGVLKSAYSDDDECESVASCTVEKEETWMNEKDVELAQALPETKTTVRDDKERASETVVLNIKEEAEESEFLGVNGDAVDPVPIEHERDAVEPVLVDLGEDAVEPAPVDLGGYIDKPLRSDHAGYSETGGSDLGGYAEEPVQPNLRGYYVEPARSDLGGYAADPEQSDLGGYAAEPTSLDLGEYAEEPAQLDLGGHTEEPAQLDLGRCTAEPVRSDLEGYVVEPARSDLGGYAEEPARSDVYAAELARSDVMGYDAELVQSDLGGYIAEPAQTDFGGYTVEHVLTGFGEEAVESVMMGPGGEAEEPVLTDPGGEAVAPALMDIRGEAVEPALTGFGAEAVEPALTGFGEEAVEPVLMGFGGETTEPTLTSFGGETAEPALMDEEEAALATTAMSAEEKTIMTTVNEEKEVASETSLMEWEEELLGITAMKIKEEASVLEEEEEEEDGNVDQLLKKLKPQSISEEPVLKSKSLVKRVTWNLQDEESDTSAAEKTPRVPFYKQQRAREVPWKVTEMSNPILNQVITQNSPLALPLPVSIPPYAPVSEPTVQFIMQGSVPLITGVAGTGLIPEPGSLVTACEPGAETASIEDTENKGKAPKQAPERVKNEEYLKKLHIQERAVEEVKLAIKPFYQKREITKDEYKDILRKAVQKICHSKSGEINPVKVANLVKAYVERYKHMRKYKKPEPEEDQESEHQTPA
ncbi:PHD and RING finger domain-containing protein 1 [Microcaecilia unicolor]|uniref:PHD and RING finger domain-containing protein 1 n=1 Tax=Microcaecilia unicolor TaxID=1415580 RepID=A0A6P7XX89_9AMPH|nr:PHD and RING finger domain-containing protein 1 [Microcaecilia unicolor]